MTIGHIISIEGDNLEIDTGEAVRRGRRKDLVPGFEPAIGSQVEFEWNKGQAKSIRPVGTVAAPRTAALAPDRAAAQFPSHRAPGTRAFRNPKNFVPAPRRASHGPLADGPRWHDVWHPGCISGSITLRATVLTPLLVLDAARATSTHDHRTLPVRTFGDGAMVPATTLKGAVRSMVEAATNSRFAVMSERERLGSRQRADGRQLVPARIETVDGELVVRLLPGTTRIGDRNGAQHAAWITASPTVLAAHGQAVEANLTTWTHRRNFTVHRVESANVDGAILVERPGPVNSLTQRPGAAMKVRGWVCAVGKIAPRKHDERFFFDTDSTRLAPTPLTTELSQQWRLLLASYRSANERAVSKNAHSPAVQERDKARTDPRASWGRHVLDKSMEVLKEGDLMYAEVDTESNPPRPIALYPVQLSRRLDGRAPIELLREELRPAVTAHQLSPADRMFGWVAPSATSPAAVRGRVAFDDAFLPAPTTLRPPVPLAILSSPKPEQSRFYLGVERPDGVSIAFDDGLEAREVRYDQTKVKVGDRDLPKALRGRAIYPRHAALDEREWKRAGGAKDDQNISIGGWIETGTQFNITLQVDDLTPEELGALLWVLDNENENRSISLGHGKPLGFGSLSTRVEASNLLDSDALCARLLDWGADSTQPDQAKLRATAAEAFRTATCAAVGVDVDQFGELDHIKALTAATGDPAGLLPIRYPRGEARIDPEGKNYEWFTRNERTGANAGVRQLALPNLTNDVGLPYHQA